MAADQGAAAGDAVRAVSAAYAVRCNCCARLGTAEALRLGAPAAAARRRDGRGPVRRRCGTAAVAGQRDARRRAHRRAGQRRDGIPADDDGAGRRLPGSGGRGRAVDGGAGRPRRVRRGAQSNAAGRSTPSRSAAAAPPPSIPPTVRTVRCRRAVIADTSAPQLYRRLLPADALPPRCGAELDAVRLGHTGVEDQLRTRRADTVAIEEPARTPAPCISAPITTGSIRWMADLNTATVPEHPFMLFGQMTTADPSRSPPGTESAWAYTHLPRGAGRRRRLPSDCPQPSTGPGEARARLRRPRRSARRSNVRRIWRPATRICTTGAVNGGTSQLFQQLIFRPAPGFGRAETPLQNVFLGSAGASPGGGVHGVCGRNAARAALAGDGTRGWPRRRLSRALLSMAAR